MTEYYLSVTEVAHKLGITTGALRSLAMPVPDAMVGRTRGWRPSTVEHWNAARPGRGNWRASRKTG
ncbi:MAG: hypothetical protein LBE08_05975 [Bifidobacteriaceae bacterium]|jgi:hypothetical protein|nr:hypothetical protein [Bifidobacteriaceae bacterium]